MFKNTIAVGAMLFALVACDVPTEEAGDGFTRVTEAATFQAAVVGRKLNNVNDAPSKFFRLNADGSMSGDIGKGATHATINFAQKVLQAELPGYIQLAGGTNDYTVSKLKQAKLLGRPDGGAMSKLSGLAYGSYARAILSPTIALLETALQPVYVKSISAQSMNQPNLKLEHHQELLEQAVITAKQLVNQIKTAHS